jgi:hypothetical protein
MAQEKVKEEVFASKAEPKVETMKVETAANETVKSAAQNIPKPKNIIVELVQSSKIEILSTATGETNIMLINNGKVSLTRGQHYKLPIIDKSLSLDTSYFVKVNKDLRNHIQILDVNNGLVTISPLVHNTILKNNDTIGIMV